MPAPSNDNFANATVITGSTNSILGNNVSATTESGEPGHYNYSELPSYPKARTIIGPFATVWYSWTCPADGDYFFSTRDLTGANRTSNKTSIQAFTGSSVNALTSVTLIMDQSAGEGTGMSNFASIAFTASSGTTYYIQIDARGSVGETGAIYLNWGLFYLPTLGACGASPPNYIYETESCLGYVTLPPQSRGSGWFMPNYVTFGSMPTIAGNYVVIQLKGAPTTGASCNFLIIDGDFGTTIKQFYSTISYSIGDCVLDCQACDSGAPCSPTQCEYMVCAGVCVAPNPTTYPFREAFTGPYTPSASFWVVGGVTSAGCYSNANTYSAGDVVCQCPTSTLSATATAVATVPAIFPGSDGGAYWRTVNIYYPAATCNGLTIGNHQSGNIGISDGFNHADYKVFGLYEFPFTASMLENDPVSECYPTGTNPNWSFSFYIKNISPTNWDNVTVTLLATGGITSPGPPQVVTLTGSSTTNVIITGVADVTAGFYTATIQISRNGVVVTNLIYPLYPILTLQLSGGVTTPYTCSTSQYQQNVKMGGSAQVSQLGQFYAAGGGDIIYTYQLDGGATNVYNELTCSVASSVSFQTVIYGFGYSEIQPNWARQADVSPGVHVLNVSIGWKVSSSVTLALPGATFNVTYP